MSLPLSLIPQSRGLRKKRTFIEYKDLDTGKTMITLNFTEGHNMLIDFEQRRYRPACAYFQIRTPGTQVYLTVPIELNDARLEDTFQVSRRYVSSFVAFPDKFEWNFRVPLTIRGHIDVVGICVILRARNAFSEQSFITGAARRGSHRDNNGYYFY